MWSLLKLLIRNLALKLKKMKLMMKHKTRLVLREPTHQRIKRKEKERKPKRLLKP